MNAAGQGNLYNQRVNEDERGITPANVTAITVEPWQGGWLVTIEQGNGDVVKTIELTSFERTQLAGLLQGDAVTGSVHLEFVDIFRAAVT